MCCVVDLQLTFVDFYWYELLELLDTIDPALLNSCSNLSSFRKRFQASYFSYSDFNIVIRNIVTNHNNC